MIFGFKFRSKPKPTPIKRTSLLVLGTEFGSYQLGQLVGSSSLFEVVAFISDDSWKQKASFGRTGVCSSGDLEQLCEKHDIAAILLPSDMQEFWSKPDNADLLDSFSSLVYCVDILSIPVVSSAELADKFLSELLNRRLA